MNGNTTQARDTSLPIPMGIQEALTWSKSLLATVHAISTSEGDEAEVKESLFSIAELLGKVIGHLDQGVDELMARRKSSLDSAVTGAMAPLTPIESRVVRMAFGIDREKVIDAHSIAEQVGISPDEVAEVKQSALRKLRGTS